MRKAFFLCVSLVAGLGGFAEADMFGSGSNQFAINFVKISGDSNPSSGIPVDYLYTFTGVMKDYRMGTYEIRNDQWNKFRAEYGPVKGGPAGAYDGDPYWTDADMPVGAVSWYEAAQFVNWLNTSTDHHAAYQFTGTQGTDSYGLTAWNAADAWGGTNLFRHKDAYYFLPTEDEWVKAAYWNGSTLQTYATPGNTIPVEDMEANYGWESGCGLWNTASGSEELNGTYNMMGNVLEWMESPSYWSGYTWNARRMVRGGTFNGSANELTLSYRNEFLPEDDYSSMGFRVASVPEPATLLLLGLGGVMVRRHKCHSFRNAAF